MSILPLETRPWVNSVRGKRGKAGKHRQQAGIGAFAGGFRMRRRIIDVMPKSAVVWRDARVWRVE